MCLSLSLSFEFILLTCLYYMLSLSHTANAAAQAKDEKRNFTILVFNIHQRKVIRIHVVSAILNFSNYAIDINYEKEWSQNWSLGKATLDGSFS